MHIEMLPRYAREFLFELQKGSGGLAVFCSASFMKPIVHCTELQEGQHLLYKEGLVTSPGNTVV